MNSGRVANAIRTLQKKQNDGVLDLQEKINGETVLQFPHIETSVVPTALSCPHRG